MASAVRACRSSLAILLSPCEAISFYLVWIIRWRVTGAIQTHGVGQCIKGWDGGSRLCGADLLSHHVPLHRIHHCVAKVWSEVGRCSILAYAFQKNCVILPIGRSAIYFSSSRSILARFLFAGHLTGLWNSICVVSMLCLPQASFPQGRSKRPILAVKACYSCGRSGLSLQSERAMCLRRLLLVFLCAYNFLSIPLSPKHPWRKGILSSTSFVAVTKYSYSYRCHLSPDSHFFLCPSLSPGRWEIGYQETLLLPLVTTLVAAATYCAKVRSV